MPKNPWKPPMWLLALDIGGFLLLGLGLAMHYLPGTAVSQALPATLRLPLLIIGGGMFAAGWGGMLLSLLVHRRS
ncbi:MAG: hypothetical protein WAZ48_05390 [Lysobacteraceae bacterium]